MTTRSQAAEIARRLAAHAEDVCRHYLSNGRREGRYWRAGDVNNTPGRSLFVRLAGPASGPGAAGRWQDAASVEHGDLLDLIAAARGLTLSEAMDEARAFLHLPSPCARDVRAPAPLGLPEAAQRLFAMSRPIRGTLAEVYLQSRGIADLRDYRSLRFHPRCFYKGHDEARRETWPALIAAITDNEGRLTGVQRTWLARSGQDKAPIVDPRRTMGHALGNGVHFGGAAAIMAAGEGVETMLSLNCVIAMPMIAALSAGNLAALVFPACLRRLYVAIDDDRAGARAFMRLRERADAAGVEALPLHPRLDDFNADLSRLGLCKLREHLRAQLVANDARFIV